MLSALFSCVLSFLGIFLNPTFIIVVLLIFNILYFTMSRNRDFWEQLGVPALTYKFPFGTGTKHPMFNIPQHEYDTEIYEACQNHKTPYLGYHQLVGPVLLLRDLEIIRHVLVKDFDHFTDRSAAFEGVNFGEFSEMMSILPGPRWKVIRDVMTPTFTSGKMSKLQPLCIQQGKMLAERMFMESCEFGEIEMKETFGRFTIDNIASIAFGADCNSLENPNESFATMAKRLVETPSLKRTALFLALMACPKIFQYYKADFFGDKEVINFFVDTVRKTMAKRDGNPDERRNDYFQLLLDARDEAKDASGNRVVTENTIMAQSFLFYWIGYEATAVTLALVAHCLATNHKVQERLLQEVDEKLYLHDNELSNELVSDMPYLDMVISETLRMYPIIPRLERVVTQPYTLTGSDIILPVKTTIQIPVWAIHHDPQHFPDPEKFDPERFTPEQKASRHPYAWMPFGHGPRNCIGIRFALLEAKIALVSILRDHMFIPVEKTERRIEFELRSQVLRAKHGIWLRLQKRLLRRYSSFDGRTN